MQFFIRNFKIFEMEIVYAEGNELVENKRKIMRLKRINASHYKIKNYL